jgi:hypothetical protein
MLNIHNEHLLAASIAKFMCDHFSIHGANNSSIGECNDAVRTIVVKLLNLLKESFSSSEIGLLHTCWDVWSFIHNLEACRFVSWVSSVKVNLSMSMSIMIWIYQETKWLKLNILCSFKGSSIFSFSVWLDWNESSRLQMLHDSRVFPFILLS